MAETITPSNQKKECDRMTVRNQAKTRRGENYYALKLEGVRSHDCPGFSQN
ncbi:MAG: hypothetical protein RIM23_08435 [Coleofasciculus sp. G3-WIS-01]|uniref:hypothetical protein n=1 Tax=Coleofasciculus sp. G3-WIS-01 TaxID=3069528 RepID=UPI0032FC21CC